MSTWSRYFTRLFGIMNLTLIRLLQGCNVRNQLLTKAITEFASHEKMNFLLEFGERFYTLRERDDGHEFNRTIQP